MALPAPEFAIQMQGVAKRFGAVVANRDVTFSVRTGTIHALIGENGAGKSTAMKILFGLQPADEGEIRVNGNVRRYASPRQAMQDGLGMVHQHFMLAEPYTGIDNIIVGDEPAVAWSSRLPRALQWQDREAAKKKIYRVLRTDGQTRDISSLEDALVAPIETLPVGQQQRIEILKLLYRDARTLILDEPTAVLTPQEISELFEYLRRLRAQGRTVVIITHKLKEVMGLADCVTVLRAGAVVGEREVAKTSEAELAELMVGRAVDLSGPKLPPQTPGDVRLTSKAFGLEIRAGEVVGIAGVEGNGQAELVADVVASRARPGLAYIPADRHREALCLDMTLEENLLLAHEVEPAGHAAFSRAGVLRPDVYRPLFQKTLQEFDVRPARLDLTARALSGGNQQKLVIAREFLRASDALVACHPTRGVDIGAIEFIHGQIAAARARGVGVLLVSSELDEVMALSDRIHVLFDHKMVASFERADFHRDQIGCAMAGVTRG